MASLTNRYEILHEQGVGRFAAGDVVPGTLIAGDQKGIDYLISIEAVEQTDEPEFIKANVTSKGLQDLEVYKTKISALEKQIEELSSNEVVATLTKSRDEANQARELMNTRIGELEIQLGEAEGKIEELTTQFADKAVANKPAK